MSRGKVKPSLRDLSKGVILDHHVEDTLKDLMDQTDRGAALMAAGLVDEFLKRAMACRMRDMPDFRNVIYEKEGAPLGTFASRIKVARALGAIGPKSESHLNIIKNIRNQFAHSIMKIDFSNSLIQPECEKMRPKELIKEDSSPFYRNLYLGTVIALCRALESESIRLRDNVIVQGLD